MPDNKEIDQLSGVETTGHEWDGLKELNNPLPRWWLWTFYITIIWGIGYTIAYPAWPMVNKATAGLLGWSSRGEVADDIKAHEDKNQALVAELVAADMTDLAATPDLRRYAVARGASVFRSFCSQCHGSGAAGATGYPNLLDDDWLWGGSIDEIAATVRYGIRTENDDARFSEMPAFGDFLEEAEIDAVVKYVFSLSGGSIDQATLETGRQVFLDGCASCHGDSGLGDREQGAPNLADAIWLYGNDPEAVKATVKYSRFGVMPGWDERLSEADIRAVSAYVHSLGGGEE